MSLAGDSHGRGNDPVWPTCQAAQRDNRVLRSQLIGVDMVIEVNTNIENMVQVDVVGM